MPNMDAKAVKIGAPKLKSKAPGTQLKAPDLSVKANDYKPREAAPIEVKTQMPNAPQVKMAFKASIPDKAAPPSKMNLPRRNEARLQRPDLTANINMPREVKMKAPT